MFALPPATQVPAGGHSRAAFSMVAAVTVVVHESRSDGFAWSAIAKTSLFAPAAAVSGTTIPTFTSAVPAPFIVRVPMIGKLGHARADCTRHA